MTEKFKVFGWDEKGDLLVNRTPTVQEKGAYNLWGRIDSVYNEREITQKIKYHKHQLNNLLNAQRNASEKKGCALPLP